MAIERRILAAAPISSSFRATDQPVLRCKHTITLDGIVYRCGRAHDAGIHDAFVVHRDGGQVRW